MIYPARKDLPILLAILLLAAFVRLNGLNEPGLWLDEISYTIAAQSPIIDQIAKPAEALHLSFDPALSAIPFSLSLSLGFSNYLVRFPAALFGIMSVAVIYRVGRMFFGNRVGLISALLLSTSSFHIFYSQEARSYAQLLFFSLASFWFFYQAVITNKLTAWFGYTVFTWGGISSHYVMAFTIFVQGVFLLIRMSWPAFWPNRRYQIKGWVYFGVSLGLVLLFRAPWLNFLTAKLTQTEGGATTFNISNSNLLSLLQGLLSNNSWILGVFIALSLLGLIIALFRQPQPGLLLACWLILSIPITQFGLWWAGQFFHERHIIWALPAFLLATAYGSIAGGQFILRLLKAESQIFGLSCDKQFSQFIVAILLLLPLLITNLNQAQQNPTIKQTWPLGQAQEAANFIAATAHPGDAVIAVPNARHIRFFIEPVRQDLIYFDAQSATFPAELQGRWYIFHDVHHNPARWRQELNINEFFDTTVVYQPNPCKIKVCLSETGSLFTEMAQANPDSALAEKIKIMMAGLISLPH